MEKGKRAKMFVKSKGKFTNFAHAGPIVHHKRSNLFIRHFGEDSREF